MKIEQPQWYYIHVWIHIAHHSNAKKGKSETIIATYCTEVMIYLHIAVSRHLYQWFQTQNGYRSGKTDIIFLVKSIKQITWKNRKVKSHLMWDSMTDSWYLIEQVSIIKILNLIIIPMLHSIASVIKMGYACCEQQFEKRSVIFRRKNSWLIYPWPQTRKLTDKEKQTNIGLLDTVERQKIRLIGGREEEPLERMGDFHGL